MFDDDHASYFSHYFQLVARHEMQLSAQNAHLEDMLNEKSFIQAQLATEKKKLADSQHHAADLQRKVRHTLLFIDQRSQ